jgi:excisionase family DNA binding protein
MSHLLQFIRVAHGAHDDLFPVIGKSVASVRRSLATVFSIPTDAVALVGGSVVSPHYRLQSGNSVLFRSPGSGQKGVLEPDELARLVRIEEHLARIEVALHTPQPLLADPDWLSIKVAAAITGLSAHTIRRAILSAVLPATNKGSKRRPLYRVKRADLLAWMEAHQTKGGHPVPPRSTLKELIDRHLPGL